MTAAIAALKVVNPESVERLRLSIIYPRYFTHAWSRSNGHVFTIEGLPPKRAALFPRQIYGTSNGQVNRIPFDLKQISDRFKDFRDLMSLQPEFSIKVHVPPELARFSRSFHRPSSQSQ